MTLRELSPLAILRGAYGVVRAPRWLAQQRLRHLLDGWSGAASVDADTERALRWASRWTRVLSKLPASPWRNTCLYRSIAEALILERRGVGSRLRIGARTEAGELHAHAWLEIGGVVHDSEYAPLQPVGSPSTPSMS